MLQQLGLRNTASLETLLTAARHIEELAAHTGSEQPEDVHGNDVNDNIDQAVMHGQVS